jgi:hypothetical protein
MSSSSSPAILTSDEGYPNRPVLKHILAKLKALKPDWEIYCECDCMIATACKFHVSLVMNYFKNIECDEDQGEGIACWEDKFTRFWFECKDIDYAKETKANGTPLVNMLIYVLRVLPDLAHPTTTAFLNGLSEEVRYHRLCVKSTGIPASKRSHYTLLRRTIPDDYVCLSCCVCYGCADCVEDWSAENRACTRRFTTRKEITNDPFDVMKAKM